MVRITENAAADKPTATAAAANPSPTAAPTCSLSACANHTRPSMARTIRRLRERCKDAALRNPFINFLLEFKKITPNLCLSAAQMAQIGGEMWRTMDDRQKEQFQLVVARRPRRNASRKGRRNARRRRGGRGALGGRRKRGGNVEDRRKKGEVKVRKHRA